MQKEQHRTCHKCSTRETRLVDEADWIFLDSPYHFLAWNEPCKNCAGTEFSERGERYATEDSAQMSFSDSSADLWLKDDDKWINLQDEYTEFMYLDIKKLLSWLDRSSTTVAKKHVLIEALCERLFFELEENKNDENILLLRKELKKRRDLVEAASSSIDPITIETISKLIG